MFNNYNPYQNYGNPRPTPMPQMPYSRPIRTPNARMPVTPPTRVKVPKMTFSKFLNGTQEVIETVTTAIPLYTQVRPLFSGAKGIGKSVKNVLFRSSKSKEYISNPEIISPKETINKKPSQKTFSETFKEENTPNRPFF